MSIKSNTKSRTKELFENIVEKFIEEAQNGKNPFDFGSLTPISANTKKPYTGLNKMVLSFYQKLGGYQSNKWLTMKQAGALDGKVNKGEKATPIFFFQDSYAVKCIKGGKEETIWSRKRTADEAKKEVKAKKGVTSVLSASKKMVLKHFYVFNYDQTTLEDDNAVQEHEKPSVVQAAASSHIEHAHGVSEKYVYEEDKIITTGKESKTEKYFKSLIEATKHESRNARELEYPEEEIIKLIGASYLMGITGLPLSPLSADLAEIFIKKLKASPNSLWKYAREADKAYGVIRNWIDEKVTEEAA